MIRSGKDTPFQLSGTESNMLSRVVSLLDEYEQVCLFCERLFYVKHSIDIGALLLEHMDAALRHHTHEITGAVYFVNEQTLEFEPVAVHPSPANQALLSKELYEQIEQGFIAYATGNNKIVIVDTICFQNQSKCIIIPLSVPDTVLGVVILAIRANEELLAQYLIHILKLYSTQASLYLSNIKLYERLSEEANIRYAEKAKSLEIMAVSIAHDFNNLLTGILGNTELVMAQLPQDSPLLSLLADNKTCAHRASILTDQMLDYAGRGQSVVQSVNLNRLIDELMQLFRSSLSKSIAIHLKLDLELPLVPVDPVQIQHVVLNLVTNSVEAIGDVAGAITISTRQVIVDQAFLDDATIHENVPMGPAALIEVADTGVGMDDKTKSRMFDPFFSTKFLGRGLGLSAVLGIMRGYHGTIKVQSEPGKGTCIKVILPCASNDIQTPREKTVKTPPPMSLGGSILVVDDDQAVRNVVKTMLQDSGYGVITARDGKEAIAVMNEYGADIQLMLVDMIMPGPGIQEVLTRIRAMKPSLRIILMSGYPEASLWKQFEKDSTLHLLSKPFDMPVLIKKIQSLLGSNAPRSTG